MSRTGRARGRRDAPGRKHRSVTLVTVTYNEAEVLEDFFAALPDALEGVEAFEVVVADNDSVDGSSEAATRLWPDATVVSTGGNHGYAAGINAAVSASGDTDAIFVLNPDIRLGPGSVRLLLEALDEDGVGISFPLLHDTDGRLLRSIRRDPSLLRAFGEALLGGDRAGRFAALGEVVQTPSAYETPSDVDWASGCTYMISRDCWDEVGPWDESFWLYSEETDYSLRCRDRGFRQRFVPEATAIHLAGPSHQNPKLWTILVYNKWRLYRRRHGPLLGAGFWFALVMNEGLRSLSGSSVHRAALRMLLDPSTRPPRTPPVPGPSA